MTQERLVFPINVPGYGEIQGMLGWQKFIRNYRHLTEAHAERGRYIESLEIRVKQLSGDDMEHLKPEHYKMVGEA